MVNVPVLETLLDEGAKLNIFSELDLAHIGLDETTIGALRTDNFQTHNLVSEGYLGVLVANFLMRSDQSGSAHNGCFYVNAYAFSEAAGVDFTDLLKVRTNSHNLAVEMGEGDSADLYIAVREVHLAVRLEIKSEQESHPEKTEFQPDALTQLAVTYSKTRDPKDMANAVCAAERLVKYVVCTVMSDVPPNVERDDIYQDGIVGLLDALVKYSPVENPNNQFSTYAAIRIRGSILDGQRSTDTSSRSERRILRTINQYSQAYASDKGMNPNLDEVAEYCVSKGFDANAVLTAQNSGNVDILRLSDVYASDDEPLTVEDSLVDETNKDPCQLIVESELSGLLERDLLEIPERNREIVQMYTVDKSSQRYISQRTGLSEARITQICQHYVANPKYFKRTRKYLDVPFVVQLKLS